VFSCPICMDLIALLYSSIFMIYFLGFLWSISSFLVLDLEIGDRKYIKIVIFSIKNIKTIRFCSSRFF
jgi:hypothetical protein